MDRIFRSPLCELELNRDVNASLNVANYYYIYQPLIDSVAASSAETLNACGETVRPAQKRARVEEAGRTASMTDGDSCHNCP